MRGSRGWIALALVGVAACAGRREEGRRAERRRPWCPPPVEWRQDQAWPLVVSIANADTQRITVFVDGCDRHERAATLAAGAVSRVRLPKRLVAHEGMVRMHWFRPASPWGLETVEVPLDSARTGRLRIELPPREASGCRLSIRMDSVRTGEGGWQVFPVVDGDWRVCGGGN